MDADQATHSPEHGPGRPSILKSYGGSGPPKLGFHGRAECSFCESGEVALLSTVAGVPGAVLEDIRLAIDREDDCTLVGVRIVNRSDPSPNEFARQIPSWS